MPIFPKILPRPENGGRNWTNTQFLEDLKNIKLTGVYQIEKSKKVLDDYNKEINKNDTSGTINKNIVDRFKVLEQIQKDIYPPLQQYINLLNIEAWYKQQTPPVDEQSIKIWDYNHPIPYDKISTNRINTPEKPISDQPFKYSFDEGSVKNILDNTISGWLKAVPNGDKITYIKYPILKKNWDNIDTSSSSFNLFSNLLTAYKLYKDLMYPLYGWTFNYKTESTLENIGTLYNPSSTNGFGRATSHIFDNYNNPNVLITLKDVIGETNPSSIKILPKSTPRKTSTSHYEKANEDLINGILIPKIKTLLS